MTSQLVHCRILNRQGSKEFYCTFVYAFNDGNGRREAWKDLEDLAKDITGPWLLTGDFNCVMNVNERIGSVVRHQEIADLCSCMNVCGMQDMVSTGCLFTWNNKQQGESRVYSKLDRVMINQEWINQFQHSAAQFLPEGLFDHCPVEINVYPQLQMGRRPFKYFHMWSFSRKFEEIVTEAWSSHQVGTPMYQVVKKLKKVKEALKQLNKAGFDEIQSKELVALTEYKTLQDQLHQKPGDVD
ncbi:uncharacterized protein LOC130589827 [Beta vulgaris subsp. vulgaris]|uniref:uncharacterized protein LOC130589827 n=1 Tax=Beta vulgaris subsp. vulgaris TaxID=3555 RepID=UPI002547409D|nr:uncharacterized protein LOC130589827 [Beta vulgaris subsp. vulgaris]